ncbi:MAG TPA: YhdP family protein [Accumulibacter sp.]|nr:YhdP family protein [Accumulibacter sp.]
MHSATLHTVAGRGWRFLVSGWQHPRVRTLARLVVRGTIVFYFAFVLLILALRYLVLPNIESYRPQIARAVGQALGLSVAIGRIDARWDGLHPDLSLSDVRIADRQGQPALAFDRVRGVLSWTSLVRWQLRLRLLTIDEPVLHLRRDVDGRLHVAGLPISEDGGNSAFGDWVLIQRRIRIRGATLVWEDAKRGAPPLILEDVNLALDNQGRKHRFGLTALPLEDSTSRIDLRGELIGQDLARPDSWQGQLFGQLDYTDLAIWRIWLDYPVALPQGRGALRAWLRITDGQPRELTADLAIADVRLQLADDLPTLELERLSGRLSAQVLPAGWRIDGRQLEMLSRPAAVATVAEERVRVGPTDFHLEWQREKDGQNLRGSASASVLDLGALAGLAAYLPLEPARRAALSDLSPRGQLSELRVNWLGNGEKLQTYQIKGRFTQLAIKPHAHWPSVTNLAGSVDASERGGQTTLQAQKVVIDVPSVFPESSIPLDTLHAQAKWTLAGEQINVDLSRAEFTGPEAAGSAKGTYRHTGSGPGSIDLSAALTRADARAVWRYLPRVVNADARQWVRRALKSGSSSEAKLTLKGDLAHFPFLDPKQGQFLVTVKADDVTLDYGPGWPIITGINGDLRFAGAGMTVDARSGMILGARLSKTRVEIPDFDAPVSMLHVKGHAEGETAEFLKFIKQSPVAEQIDHFTDRMSAVGPGRLAIGLTIPLQEARLGESQVDGDFTILDNELQVDADLPPLKQIRGNLHFTAKELRFADVSARLFGGPLKISGGTSGGKLAITADGTLNTDELRRQNDMPLLKQLTGNSAYRAELRVRKLGDVQWVVNSNLLGLASTLPAPFNKAATDSIPLHLEISPLPSTGRTTTGREQMLASLGQIASLQLITRKKGPESIPERGALMIGRPLTSLPERGVAIGISAKVFDVDAWRNMLPASGKDGEFPMSLDLKADELILLGKYYNDVSLAVWGLAPHWRGMVQSRDASGNFNWDGSARGKLTAHFKKWRRPDKESSGAPTEDVLKELPALDVVVDDFAVGARQFGRLDVQAHNEGSLWRLSKVTIGNPHGTLNGSGQWQFANGNRTQLDFTLESDDVGALLDRLGYGGAVRGGVTTMRGKIGWNAQPTALDYATLSGEIQLEATKGRFLKLEPGAGRLLGLISLQGLPRRFLLDFGDVFSEGFAFDSINGRMSVKSGLMRSDRLQIDGPAARVMISGETNLKQETQRLRVTVQPELGGSAALGVALVNPLAGAATLLAHKLLQNPLNKMFGVEYLVTGKWDDPKVEKLSRSQGTTADPLSNPGQSALPAASQHDSGAK